MSKTIITSKPDSIQQFFQKIWKYRALIWVFAIRDLKVKYAQTWLGLGWSVLQPLTALVIFTYFFGYLLDWKAGDLPYAIYILSGLLGWNFFTYIVNSGSLSIQESSQLIRKIYFPKSILPLSKVLVAGVEMGISLVLLFLLLIYFDQAVSWQIVFLPLVILFNAVCALTLVFWVAVFAYKKRDLLHVLTYIVYFGIWVTPVFFTHDFLPDTVGKAVYYNPMASVVDLWRWSLFSYGTFQLTYLYTGLIVMLLFIVGMYLFNKRENEFSDYA